MGVLLPPRGGIFGWENVKKCIIIFLYFQMEKDENVSYFSLEIRHFPCVKVKILFLSEKFSWERPRFRVGFSPLRKTPVIGIGSRMYFGR